MTLTVYGNVLSPFVRKAHIVLLEKQVPFQAVDLNPLLPPDKFAEISPLRRIPVLHDSSVGPDWHLADSSAICAYLERRHPLRGLYPTADHKFATALWIEEYADTEFSHTIGQKIFGPTVIQKLTSGNEDRSSAEAAFQQELLPYLDYLDKLLSGAKFFIDDVLTIADISVAVHLQNLAHAGFSVPGDRFPALAQFADHMLSRPSFEKCRLAETELLDALGFSR